MSSSGPELGDISVVVFDVNETISDMGPMSRRFEDIDAPGLAAKLWFASVLRDGFARTAAGGFEHFVSLAEGALRTVLAGIGLSRDMDSAVGHVMEGFMRLDVHSDVPEGVRRLRGAGLKLVTLTNGSAEVAERLLSGAGVRSEFDVLLSVDGARVWKPAPGSYRYAARACGVPEEQMLLVSVHPWDIDGAATAGLRTAWVDRDAAPYPPYFTRPDHVVPTLTHLAERVGVRRR